MRQIGLLESAQEANRFTAYLIVQKIRAMVEQEGEKFAVWVREENDLARARDEFQAFLSNPNDPRYLNKEREAEAILRAERDQRLRGQKNVVQVKQQAAPMASPRRAPLCMAMLGVAIAVTLFHFSQENRLSDPRNPMWSLFFTDYAGFQAAASDAASTEQAVMGAFSAIARGEVWRLVTPCFIHMSWVHLIFNGWALIVLGSRLENRFGAVRLSLWMLAIAVFSNVAQALADSPLFGGLSGVLYGVFGIALVYSMRAGDRDRLITRDESTIYMIWLVMCIILSSDAWAQSMGQDARMHVANVAHVAGMLFGGAIGYILSLRAEPGGA
jgi:GlpG protein